MGRPRIEPDSSRAGLFEDAQCVAGRFGEDDMKFVCFDDFQLGVLKGSDSIVDVTPVVRDAAPGTPQTLINGVIERFAHYRGRIEQAVADGTPLPLSAL